MISLAALLLSILLNKSCNTDPFEMLWLQYLAVFSPFLIILNTSILIYWSYRKSLLLIIPLIALVINYKHISAIFNIQFKSTPPSSNTITVGSYNVNYFSNSQYSNVPEIAKTMVDNGVDILAFQEFRPTDLYNLNEIKGEFYLTKHMSVYNEDKEVIGMALFSRYPIIRSTKINFEHTGNGAMWADILYKGDTIRVINNHLQTTGYYSSYRFGFKHLVKVMGENFLTRSVQAKTIRQLIDTTAYPVIVMGDFNDTPNSFVYNTIKGDDLIDTFSEKGSGTGGTFRRTMGLLRIDMIFHSPHFETIKFKVGSEKLSDHKPVIAVLGYKN